MQFSIDLSLVTGNLDLNLDDSNPPKFKLQKNTLSALQKINVLKSLSNDTNLNVKLTSTNMPLPNQTWWEQSRIVELKGGGSEINSDDTSKIPTACSSVELNSTELSEFNDIPSNIKSLTLLDNNLLQAVFLNKESNLEEINLEKTIFYMMLI